LDAIVLFLLKQININISISRFSSQLSKAIVISTTMPEREKLSKAIVITTTIPT
jgi:hypothetical protein